MIDIYKIVKDKDELEKLLNVEKVSYEELGRRLGCSGATVKKIAKREGIQLERRRNVSEEELNSLRHREGRLGRGKCEYCGNEFKITYRGQKYCSIRCSSLNKSKKTLDKWLTGDNVTTNYYSMPKYVRKYVLERAGNKCEVCGWCEVNQSTGIIPLQVHHIDGNPENNRLENLQVLCPNHHALTENFGSKNKSTNATRERTKYFERAS